MEEKKSDIYSNDYGLTPTIESDPYDDEIRKALHDNNYKLLLNSAISRNNLRRQSQKYLDTQLQSQGMSSQGYGTSAHVGLNNTYSNLYAQDLSNYYKAESQADVEQIARREEADKTLGNFIGGTNGSIDDIRNYMMNAGFQYDENSGKWLNERGEEPSAYVKNAIEFARRESDAQSIINKDNIAQALLVDGKNNKEVNKATLALGSGGFSVGGKAVTLEDGMVLKLNGTKGEVVRYVKYDARTNSYRISNEKEFNEQKGGKYENYDGNWRKIDVS